MREEVLERKQAGAHLVLALLDVGIAQMVEASALPEPSTIGEFPRY